MFSRYCTLLHDREELVNLLNASQFLYSRIKVNPRRLFNHIIIIPNVDS